MFTLPLDRLGRCVLACTILHVFMRVPRLGTIKESDAMRQEKGFSLLELVIVCVLLVIIAAISIPNITRMNANYKLDAAGHSVASLLQQARMQAVKTNQPAYTKYDANG